MSYSDNGGSLNRQFRQEHKTYIAPRLFMLMNLVRRRRSTFESRMENPPMLSDIEIAQKATMKPISQIAAGLSIPDDALDP